MKIDPICKMEVKEEEALTAVCDGITYYFCSEGCKTKFLMEITCQPRTGYDLIIIGGGPAGLTAAVYCSTLKLQALLISKDLGGQAIDSSKVENYLGFDFISGPELVEKFKNQLIHPRYIDHLMSEAEKIEPVEGGFRVISSELTKYFAPALLIATGMTRRRLNVPGEEKFQRRGIFYGNIQDLTFAQGKDVAVIGGGNSALQIVENLRAVAENIYLVSTSELSADPMIIERISHCRNISRYEDHAVVEFTGENVLAGITIRKKGTTKTINLAVKGVFIAVGLHPNSSLVAKLLELNEKGEIVIKPDCSTSCPGIFAAGDVTNAFGKRIIIASGEGAKAALAARQYILNLRKKPCV